MLRSSKKRRRAEQKTDALEKERAHRANGKPLILQPLQSRQGKKGDTLVKLSDFWPVVNDWRSTLGSKTW